MINYVQGVLPASLVSPSMLGQPVGAALLAWFILALIAIALVGVAATIGVMLFLLIPAAVIVALISSQMRRQAP